MSQAKEKLMKQDAVGGGTDPGRKDGGGPRRQMASNSQDGVQDPQERLRRLEESVREMDEQYTLQSQQQLQQQLDQTKQHHDAFRDRLLSLDLHHLVSSADRTQFFFDTSKDEGERRKADEDQEEQDKLGMDPTDVEVLRQVRLKIVNYLLSQATSASSDQQDGAPKNVECSACRTLALKGRVSEELASDGNVAVFEIYSKTSDPRSLLNQVKRNERLVEKCKEDFAKNVKAVDEMKKWMDHVCQCLQEANSQGTTSGGKSGNAEMRISSDFFNRLSNITTAYRSWLSTTKSATALTSTEKTRYAKEFEKKKEEMRVQEVKERRQESVDVLEEIRDEIVRMNKEKEERERASRQQDATAALPARTTPSSSTLASDIHETLGSLHSHLASLKNQHLLQQEKRAKVDVSKIEQDILSHSAVQIDERLRVQPAPRGHEPLPRVALDVQEEGEVKQDISVGSSPSSLPQLEDPALPVHHLAAYQDLISRLEEQLAHYHQHQASEMQRQREHAEQLEAERHARMVLSQESVEEMVNVVMDEDGAIAKRRHQGEQVNRRLFEAEASTQYTLAVDNKAVQADVGREEWLRRQAVKIEGSVAQMEIADEYTKLREYRSPIGKDDISNIVQEVLNEGQQKLQDLSPNARTLESAVQMEILGGGSPEKSPKPLETKLLEGKLEERSKLDRVQKEMRELRAQKQQVEQSKRALEDQATQLQQRAAALTAQQTHLNKQKMTLIEKIKQQNVQKQQLSDQELKLHKLQQFLQQREQEQIAVEQAFDKEKLQLDEEWQELAKEWNAVEEQKEGLTATQEETRKRERKIEKRTEKMKQSRARVIKMEKMLIVKEARLRDMEGQIRQILQQIEKLLQTIRQDGGHGSQLTQDQRERQMAVLAHVKQLNAEAMRQAANSLRNEDGSLGGLRARSSALQPRTLRGRAILSDAGRRRGDSFASNDSNLSYLRFRYDNSFDASDSKVFAELKEDVLLGQRRSKPVKKQPPVKIQKQPPLNEQNSLPRYSRRSRCSVVGSSRASVYRGPVPIGSGIRLSLRPSLQIRHSMRASQALVRNSVARRSTIWPHSVRSQVDEVDENIPEEADFNLLVNEAQSNDQPIEMLGNEHMLLTGLDMSGLNPYKLLSPIQDQNEASGDEDADPIRRTQRSDKIMKEISFKTLTRVTDKFYDLNLINDSGSTDSQADLHLRRQHYGEEDLPEDEDEHVDLEYTRTVTDVRRTAQKSSSEGKRQTSSSAGGTVGLPGVPGHHQGTQASDLPMPNLDLSAYVEYEREAASKSKGSASVALQTGESIRNSIRGSVASRPDNPKGQAWRGQDPRGSKQSHGQESTLSFANNQSFLVPQQLMINQPKPSEESGKVAAVRNSTESNQNTESLNETRLQLPPSSLLDDTDAGERRPPAPIVDFPQITEVPAMPALLVNESNHSERQDVSILNYTMDEFIQYQLADLEKIGISGELFREVWEEYRRQGKSKQQMQSDLIQYQFMIEQKIQRANRRRLKKEKKEKDGKQKDKKRDKKEKKDKKKSRRSRPEEAMEKADEELTVVEQEQLHLRNVGLMHERQRKSSRHFNYDEDFQESSVFTEPFKLQERETIDPDRSLIYHDRSSKSAEKQGSPNEVNDVMPAGAHHQKTGSSRFSVSFAHGEAQSESTQEVKVEEYMDNSEYDQGLQAVHIANADLYGGSLINQIQNNQNLFMIFKARESAKGGSGRKSEESKKGDPSREVLGSSLDWNAGNEALVADAAGAGPGMMVPGIYTRSLKTIQEEANECTENRDPSPHDSDSHTVAKKFRIDMMKKKDSEGRSNYVTGKPLQRASLRNIQNQPLPSKAGINSSSELDLSSQSNSRRSIKYFEQLKSLNAMRKSARLSAKSGASDTTLQAQGTQRQAKHL